MPDRRDDEAVIAELRDAVNSYITALMVDGGENVPGCERRMAEAFASLSLRLQNAETALEAARQVVREFDMWSEDANDGEFAYYRSDGLMTACVALRAALASSAEREPEHAEAVEKAQAFVRGEVQGKCCAEWPECSHVFEAVTDEPWAETESGTA